MTQRISMILGAIALLALPTLADARAQGQGAMLPGFDMLDNDQSGQVTLEQFQTALDAARAAMRDEMIARLMQEADDEGKLDETALRAGIENLRGARSNDRAASMQERLFARIDADGDGVITASEYEAFQARTAQRMERRGMNGNGPRGWKRAQ